MKPLRVLLIVNSENVAKLLRRILSSHGHIYVVAEWWYGEKEDSHFQRALNYLHDSGGQVDIVIADFFPKGIDPTKLCIAPIVVKCRQLKPSPKVFALPGSMSSENISHWAKDFRVDGVLPDPSKDPALFEAKFRELVARYFGKEKKR